MIIFILQLVPISPKLLLFPKAPGKKRDPGCGGLRLSLVFPLVQTDRLIQLAEPLLISFISHPHQVVHLFYDLVIDHAADILTQLLIVFLDGLSDHLSQHGPELLRPFLSHHGRQGPVIHVFYFFILMLRMIL